MPLREYSEKPKPKGESGKKRRRRSGDRVQLSAFGDRDAAESLSNVDRRMPEKMRMRETGPGQHMQSVRPGTYTEYGQSPEKMAEVQTDTGRAEIGYDPKKMDTVVSFVQDESSQKGRQVVENKSVTRRAMDGEKFRSNDRSFETGAMSLRVNADKSPMLVRRQLMQGGGRKAPSTLDRVIPFHSRREEEQVARRRLVESGGRAPGASKAATAMQTIANRKDSQAQEFTQKFDRAIQKTRLTHKSGDMYLILMRKKRLILEALARGEAVPEDVLNAVDASELDELIYDETMQISEKDESR